MILIIKAFKGSTSHHLHKPLNMSESTSRKRKQPTSSAAGPSSIKVRVGDGATVAGPAFGELPSLLSDVTKF